MYLQLEGVHVTTMQVVFNVEAEKVLCPEERLCCLYVLLFYSVLAYLQRALQVCNSVTVPQSICKSFTIRSKLTLDILTYN